MTNDFSGPAALNLVARINDFRARGGLLVADYFEMLGAEIPGVPYSKTTHRQRLLKRLHGRSDGSVEFKHANISAVLIELGSE